LGLEKLWIKDDSVNPSNSFKDRVVTVAITMARAFGFEAISCASTGNLANATAAHAAKANMPCYVFVPDDLERAKILATAGLSFLGLGTQPPTADWGSMLATARTFVILSPHVALLPGLAIFLVVLSLNVLGDALQDYLDPRMRHG